MRPEESLERGTKAWRMEGVRLVLVVGLAEYWVLLAIGLLIYAEIWI